MKINLTIPVWLFSGNGCVNLLSFWIFPDNFIFAGSKESVRKQIGMAVPPRGAKIIIEAVSKTFAGVPYDWVPAKLSNGNNGFDGTVHLNL